MRYKMEMAGGPTAVFANPNMIKTGLTNVVKTGLLDPGSRILPVLYRPQLPCWGSRGSAGIGTERKGRKGKRTPF